MSGRSKGREGKVRSVIKELNEWEKLGEGGRTQKRYKRLEEEK